MKKVDVPFVSQSEIEWETLPLLLETRGKRISIGRLNWAKDFPYRPICLVDVAYHEKALLLHYFVRGLELRTLSAGDGNYVHEDSCVEFFMQPEEGESYINFEFNAAGVSYSAHHQTIKESTKFTPEEFATIRRNPSFTGGKVDIEEGIHQWELTVEIPFTTMGYAEEVVPDTIRANFYKCADGTAHPHYLSWTPIKEPKPAFHRPQFFGLLRLKK